MVTEMSPNAQRENSSPFFPAVLNSVWQKTLWNWKRRKKERDGIWDCLGGWKEDKVAGCLQTLKDRKPRRKKSRKKKKTRKKWRTTESYLVKEMICSPTKVMSTTSFDQLISWKFLWFVCSRKLRWKGRVSHMQEEHWISDYTVWLINYSNLFSNAQWVK